MLFQIDAIVLGAIITVIVIAILMFFIGVKVTQWYAKKKNWDPSFATAAILNVIWFGLDIVLGLLFTILFEGGLLFDILRLIIAIIIGAFLVMLLYKKKFGESLIFVIVVQIILFIIAIILGIIIGLILGVVLVALLL